MWRHRVTVGSGISVIAPFLILLEAGLVALIGASATVPLVERLLFLVCLFAGGSAVSCAASDDDCKSVVMVASFVRVVDLVFLRLTSLSFPWSFSWGSSWRVVVSWAVSETSLLPLWLVLLLLLLPLVLLPPLLLILLLQLLLLELVMTWQRGSGTSALNPILLSHDLSWNWKLECLLRGPRALVTILYFVYVQVHWRQWVGCSWNWYEVFCDICEREEISQYTQSYGLNQKLKSLRDRINHTYSTVVGTYCWSINVGTPVVMAELLQVAITEHAKCCCPCSPLFYNSSNIQI